MPTSGDASPVPAAISSGAAAVSEAVQLADAAAERAGVVVRELGGPGDRDAVTELDAVAALFQHVWHAPNVDQVINCSTMRALAHAGNYVVAAYRAGEPVGASVGFLGLDADGVQLHSHLAGVVPGGQGRGVGWVLKQHQRAWALARGIRRVFWTFDPLVSRNAYFNLQKLGGLPVEYLPNFYGVLDDEINLGDETDRLVMLWLVDSPRAIAAARQELPTPDADALRAAGAVVLVDRAGDEPTTPDEGTVAAAVAAGATLLIALPGDIEEMRVRRPGPDQPAAAWRRAVRDAVTTAFAAGYRFDGFDKRGWYVLVTDEQRSDRCG